MLSIKKVAEPLFLRGIFSQPEDGARLASSENVRN